MHNLCIDIRDISLAYLYCCNLFVGIALIVWFTTKGTWAKNKNIYVHGASKQLRRMTSIIACCRGVKLCTHVAWNFRSQQNGAVTRMWRSCRVQPSHKERVIGVFHCKKEGMLLQPLQWRCIDCVIHHERDVCKEQKYMCMAQASNNKRLRCMISVACCHGAKLCAHAARDFRSQQYSSKFKSILRHFICTIYTIEGVANLSLTGID